MANASLITGKTWDQMNNAETEAHNSFEPARQYTCAESKCKPSAASAATLASTGTTSVGGGTCNI